jgi:hypothetical protein
MIGCIKLRNEEFVPIAKYSCGEEMQQDDMDGACMTHGRNKNCMKNLFAKPESKRTIERPKRRMYYNIQRYYKN